MAAPPTVLEVQDLTKRYGDRVAVQGISFSIRRGEIFGLLGPNGAGKTSTIGMIATIVPASSGQVRVAGRVASHQPEETRKRVGLVPQRSCFYPSLTAEENVRFIGRLYGLDGGELTSRVSRVLEIVGLDARRREPVARFSGGMQRRLNLACGLVQHPELLLLDEPTVGVDPQSRERIFTAVEELAAQGMGLLYTTHYMEEAERLCHRVAIMDEGRVVAKGTVKELARLVAEGVSVRATFEVPPSGRLLEELLKRGAQEAGPARFQLPGGSADRVVAALWRLAAAEKNAIRELVLHRPNLGEVFLHLTGKELRD